MTKTEKKPKQKVLRNHGHINIPNVGSSSAECITLTCSISNVKDLKQVNQIAQGLDEETQESGIISVEISDYGSENEAIKMKWKVKACDSDQDARDIKHKADLYIKQLGGQTTIDQDFTESEKKEAAAIEA